MNISLTFDVEIWCGSWRDLDARFPTAFQRYVYGKGPAGYALPKTLEWLNRWDLHGVFFVEPLFSYRFGHEYLQEIVDLILGAGQEVQLHLHPEWSDEVSPHLGGKTGEKRPYLHQYEYSEQVALIAKGLEALRSCGVPAPSAFRAGSYACNRDTFRALAENGLYIDTSLNTAYPGSGEDLLMSERREGASKIEGILEYPVTVFRDGFGKPRHWQVGAVGFSESVRLVQQAAAKGHENLVLVSHNFEMLVPGKSRVDPIVASRFEKLCRWLGTNADQYPVVSLAPDAALASEPPSGLQSPFFATAGRMSAQIVRRVLEKF